MDYEYTQKETTHSALTLKGFVASLERKVSIPHGAVDYGARCTTRDEFCVSSYGRAAVSDYLLKKRVQLRKCGALFNGPVYPGQLQLAYSMSISPEEIGPLFQLAVTPDPEEE